MSQLAFGDGARLGRQWCALQEHGQPGGFLLESVGGALRLAAFDTCPQSPGARFDAEDAGLAQSFQEDVPLFLGWLPAGQGAVFGERVEGVVRSWCEGDRDTDVVAGGCESTLLGEGGLQLPHLAHLEWTECEGYHRLFEGSAHGALSLSEWGRAGLMPDRGPAGGPSGHSLRNGNLFRAWPNSAPLSGAPWRAPSPGNR